MRVALFGLFVALVCAPAAAQMSPARLAGAASVAKDLEFPAKLSTFSFFSGPHMAIYKPEGAGPFPALVILHQCGGLSSGRWQNQSILEWAKEAVKRGYVAMVVDSLAPRGVDTVCFSAKGGVNPVRGAKDAFQAAQHLRKLDFVDRKRIAMAGYSWGAGVAAMAAGRMYREALAGDEGIAAFASFYPPCFTLKPPSGATYEWVNEDIDRPLLVLMGDKDNETPPEECVPRLEKAKAAGAPVEWHVYPGITHCWDCENLNGFEKQDFRGTKIVYYYDKAITQDSAQRMFAFFEKAFSAR